MSSPNHISLTIDEDDKFSNRLDMELQDLMQSDSPLTMSAANSDDDNDASEKSKPHKFKKLSFQEVEESMNRHYNTDKSVGEMETLIAHIKCQKTLYIEAKNHSQRNLNYLMIPSVLIATLITVLTPFISTVPNGSYIITAMNAVTTLILSLINHLKLETNTKNYEQIAVRYDKIQSSLELFSTKIIFSNSGTEYKTVLYEKLKDTEDKLLEIKEQNNLLLPEEVKQMYPIISNVNIFSTIKSIEMHRKSSIENLRSVKNEIRFIHFKWNMEGYKKREEPRLKLLIENKDVIKKDLTQHFNAFSYINDIFEKELEKKSHFDKKWFWQTELPTIPVNSKLVKYI